MSSTNAKNLWAVPNRPNIFTEAVEVTPDIALLMLSTIKVQRPCSDSLVRKLAKKMADGRWLFTHQGIAFSNTRALIDGQHRLNAVVMSEKAQTFLVTYNLPPDAFRHMDVDGRQRTAADLLSFDMPEAKNKTLVTSAASMMLRGMEAVNARSFGPAEVALFARERFFLIEPFVQTLKGAASSRLVSRAPVVAAFAAAVRDDDLWPGPKGYREQEPVLLAAMRLAEQEWEGKTDPMRKLWDRFLVHELSKRGDSLTPIGVYQLTVSAVRAAIAGKKIKTIVPSSRDWGDVNDHGGSIAKSRRGKLSRKRLDKKGSE